MRKTFLPCALCALLTVPVQAAPPLPSLPLSALTRQYSTVAVLSDGNLAGQAVIVRGRAYVRVKGGWVPLRVLAKARAATLDFYGDEHPMIVMVSQAYREKHTPKAAAPKIGDKP